MQIMTEKKPTIQTIPTNVMGSKLVSKKVRLLEAKNGAAEQSIRTSLYVNVDELFSKNQPLEEAIFNMLRNWNFFDYMFEDGTLFSIHRNLPYRKFEGSVNIHVNREYNTETIAAFGMGEILVKGEFDEGVEVCKKFLELIREHSAKLKEAVPVAG